MNEDKRSHPLRAPVTDKKREGARTAIEAAASLIPGGGAVVRVARLTHPPKSEHDRKQWQQAISDRTNEHAERLDDHEQRLNPTRILQGATAELVAALASNCPDGLGHKKYELADLCALLPEVENQKIEDAVFDLEHHGLLFLTRTLGGRWRANLTPRFYEEIDNQLMKWDTDKDAITLARLMLENDEGRAATLHEASGWSKRRFNPAFRILLGHFPQTRVSQEIQPDYVSSYVVLAPEDRVRLRRLSETA